MKYVQQKPTDDFSNIDLLISNAEENLKHLKAIDDIQAAKGRKLLYRYFKIPVADGHAYYQITKVTKTTATVTLCEGISIDNYQYISFGKEHIIPIKVAQQYIELRVISEEILNNLKTKICLQKNMLV